MHKKITELAHLLTHGASKLCIEPARPSRPVVIWLDCTPLWVEMHLPRRLRMASILYGDPMVYTFAGSLTPGKYTGYALMDEVNNRLQAFNNNGASANNGM